MNNMTSTNLNIGLPESRSSSRVLRPPGGGHSDIFGLRGDPIPTAKRGPCVRSTSSIILGDDVPKGKPKVVETVQEALPEPENGSSVEVAEVNNGVDHEDGVINNENCSPASPVKQVVEEAKKEEAVAPPARVRVPPGGFSSGLW